MANNNSENNRNPSQVNPYNLYNLGITSQNCGSNSCIPNTVEDYGYTIPSIQEIAANNYAMITRGQGRQIMPEDIGNQNFNFAARSVLPVPENNPAVQEIQTIDTSTPYNPDSLQTPATVGMRSATLSPQAESNLGVQVTDFDNPYPVTAESIQYLNGFIRTQIGRRVSIDFLVGSNTLVTKSGYLLGVAANYILINELDTNDLTTCDFYNIKFIRFYYD